MSKKNDLEPESTRRIASFIDDTLKSAGVPPLKPKACSGTYRIRGLRLSDLPNTNTDPNTSKDKPSRVG